MPGPTTLTRAPWRATRVAAVSLAACALLGGTAPAATANTITMTSWKATGADNPCKGTWYTPARFGPWNVKASRGEDAARRAFGEPTAEAPLEGQSKRLTWASPGIAAIFLESPHDATRPWFAPYVEVTGPTWRTQRGLRIGARERAIRRLHPAARRHGSRWTLYRACTNLGISKPAATLSAHVRGGKVVRFSSLIEWD
jgi:hypothetical protein